MSRIPKVEIQKGHIDPNPKTMKTMTHAEKVQERREEMALLRHGQTLDLHEPRK